jgi:hypothetical protein
MPSFRTLGLQAGEHVSNEPRSIEKGKHLADG